MSELLQEFVFDSREHLGTAGTQLLALEKEPNSLTSLNALMGTLHTIKGNSGFVNLRHLYELLHASESLLQTIRDIPGHLCPPLIIERLFQVLDTVDVIMGRLEKGEDDEVEWRQPLLESILEAASALEKGEISEPNSLSSTSFSSTEDPTNKGFIPATPEGTILPHLENSKNPFDTSQPIQILFLNDGQLASEGPSYLENSPEVIQKGSRGLILDMRKITSFTSEEQAILEKLRSLWGKKLGILLSLDQQPDFYRVFTVLGMDTIYQFYPDEVVASKAL
ncbi:MAG: Hpt domain-containing protein [Deltaproteobacteria bacterium]|jgi:chemotaxis protein histidine kinase CheA|nr:Hpt domain-containing protein [Deltaproteobacteria bacterium]